MAVLVIMFSARRHWLVMRVLVVVIVLVLVLVFHRFVYVGFREQWNGKPG